MDNMNQSEKKIINDYRFSRITKNEFLQQVPLSLKNDKRLAQSILTKAFQDKNKEILDIGFAIMLIQADLFGFPVDTKILCNLLLESWHFSHEDIAMVLQDIKDPSTVECLFTAAQLQFKYLNYDDTYQLARKCIKALSAINNKESIIKLKLLSNNPNSEIKEYANKELRNLDIK